MPPRTVQSKRPDAQAADEKRRKAFELRKAGWSYAKVGEAIGVSKTRAYHYVMDVIKELRDDMREDAVVVREQQLARLDGIIELAQGIIDTTDDPKVTPEVKLKAADRIVRAEDMRARLIGTLAPADVRLSGKDGGPINVTADIFARQAVQSLSDEELDRELAAFGYGAAAQRQVAERP